MTESLAQHLVEFFGTTIPANWTIFIISLLPILELRGGLIAAALLKVPFWKAFLICYLGNIIPIPFIVFLIEKIFVWLSKYKFFAKIINKLQARAEKNRQKIMKYEEWGLLLFVAIPLPGTGGWTGSLFAALLGLDKKKSIPIIMLGVLIAGIIMTIFTYLVPGLAEGKTLSEIFLASA